MGRWTRCASLVLGPCLAVACAPGLSADELPDLARRFAPVVRQDTGDSQDYLTAFDFDGDWNGANNWDNQPRFANRAVVYWAGVESDTHVFLTYGFFHPRDYSRPNNPVTSHENDLEGAVVVLEKSDEDHLVVALETVFHKKFLRYGTVDGYPVIDPDGALLFEGERPVLWVEARGHGVRAWEGGEFRGGDGVVYRPGQVSEVPEGPNDRDVSYTLVDLGPTLWARRHEIGPGLTYGKGQYFQGELIGIALNGLRYGDHKAHVPWGWDAEGLPRGTFFLDPARMIAEHYEVPGSFARDYLPNPYTGSAQGAAVARQGRFGEAHRALAD